MRWLGGASPIALVIGPVTDQERLTAARLLLRYTKAVIGEVVRVSAYRGEERLEMQVAVGLTEEELERLRI